MKDVDHKKLWNFVVDKFLIWNHLVKENYIWISKKLKFQNFGNSNVVFFDKMISNQKVVNYKVS